MLILLISLAGLAACGGGNAPVQAPSLPQASAARLPAPDASGLPTASPVVLPGQTAAALRQGARRAMEGSDIVTDITLENTGSTEQKGAPLTFGQVFAPGHLGADDTLRGELGDGSTVPLQVVVKARHPDGSARHALISLLAPALAPGQARSIALARTSSARAAWLAQAYGDGPSPAALLDKGFSAQVRIQLGDKVYSASPDALLRAGKFSTWLAGPLTAEWHVSTPLADADGVPHPHLAARFALRAAQGNARARVDVTLENAWAFEPAPQNFTYDAEIRVAGTPVYTKPALTHYHHARWRKVFWWGGAPQVHLRHNTAYLIATRAVPNYDRSLQIGETELQALRASWSGPRTEPMGSGLANPYMPTTGGRPDIGLLPGWAATYLLSMDARAKEVTLGSADLAGSWPAHYRNKATGRPVSLFEYPYMTIYGLRTDTVNPATKQQEAFPICAAPGACATATAVDTSHQPGFAYLPYLVTGDYYYLEELHFYTMWNTFQSNPGYRDRVKGLFKSDQVRGQGWSLRTLAQAAYITPDDDSFKAQFAFFLKSNLDWYNASYSANPAANALGAIVNGYALGYDNGTALAPWMDDFFTSAIGHAVELGRADAIPLLKYKIRFPIARMTATDACWITGAAYSLKVRDSATSPFYASMGQAWHATNPATLAALPCASADMAAALKLKVGEMTGYSYSNTGFPSNMQPALAYAADAGGADGAAAWAIFAARSVKPDYRRGPQFAVLPRQ